MIVAFYAGILGIIYLALTFYVIKGRFEHKVSLGDGDNENMQKRIRAHANFAEFVPFALFLMFVAEWEGMADPMTHILGLLLIFGRLLHGAALLEFNTIIPKPRQIGMVSTIFVMASCSLFCVFSIF